MNSINETYLNALLADAAYVNLHQVDASNNTLTGLLTGAEQTTAIAARMTQPQAEFITTNFEVLNQELSATGGFDATVWRGKAGTEYEGKVYVSMRGTQQGQDFVDDANLALSGIAYRQLESMANWWLRETAAKDTPAMQIKIAFNTSPWNFVVAPSVMGTGNLAGIGAIEQVNGHSLGGYMAVAFTRLFGSGWNVGHTTTFNSAGFRSEFASQIEMSFAKIQSLVGSSFGRSNFNTTAEQDNLFAENGVNVTTNDWNNPAGFTQYGQRTGLYQEDGLQSVFGVPNTDPFSNHYMFKQTDLLALGAALEKLDSTMTFATLNDLVKAGSNVMAGSYEGVLDGLRRIFQGNSITSTQIGDVSDVAASRVNYQTNLDVLTKSDAFKGLIGKVTVESATASDLATRARTDFGAFLSLNALSPVVISTIDTTALATLKQANATLAQQWEADLSLTQAQKDAGLQNFTDVYLLDRQAMLQGVIAHNMANTEFTVALKGKTNADYTYTDFTSSQIIKFKGTAPNAIGQEAQQVMFGNDQDNGLVGSDATAFGLGDRLYGGAGNDYINANAGDDYLEGNAGADNLNGGEGRDTLLGGAGDDTLDGGKEADFLKGGAGSDTYILRAGDSGSDTIVDADGQGQIKVYGSDGSETTLGTSPIKKLANATNTWQTEDKRFTYTTSQEGDGSVTLLISGAGVTTRVKNFTSGNLGITLPEAPAAEPAPSPVAATYDLGTYEGNRAWDSGPGNALAGYHLLNAVQPEPGDTTPSASWVRGFNGDDIIEGGAIPAISQTVVRGNGGNDRIYAQVEQDLQQAIEQGETLPGSSSSNYLLDGGAGNDLLVGSAGADALFGGAGDDTMVGGAGSDLIISDGDVGNIASAGGTSWVTGSNDPLTGQARRLDMVHEGARLYLSPSDSTGQRTPYYAHLANQLDMTYDLDYQNLRTLVGQDVRNLGYTYNGTVLDSSTSIGSQTVHASGDFSYSGSLIQTESFNTARHTGNDTIYAGAGDDVVNAGGGIDTVLAGSGNDIVVGGAGDDSQMVAIKLIAACGDKVRAAGRFDTQERVCRRVKQIHPHCSGAVHPKSVYAHPVRPASRKGQGRHMGSAQAISIQVTIK